MEIKNKMGARTLARVLAVVMAFCLIFSMAITANAATVNQAVTNAKNGVVQIQVWFSDTESATEHYLHSGTGFLINDNTVVTCQHVATGFPDEWYVEWAQATNKALGGNRTAAQVKENLELRVSVLRDVYVKATVKKASTEMDYAILSLNETIHNRTPLVVRDSDTLNQTEEVFALGFPADIASLEDSNHYDAADVTITSGHVNKVGNMSFKTTDGGIYNSVSCVESSALITGGNSGGPLVDANGYVVGINAAGNDTRNIAISSKQLMDVLDALGIEYQKNGATAPAPTPTPDGEVDTSELSSLISKAEGKDAANYTEESYSDLEDALSAAEAAMSATTQEEVDAAAADLDAAIEGLEKAEETGSSAFDNYVTIGIIVAIAVVVIVVVIILIVVLGKKNNKPQVAPAPPAQPPVQNRPPVQPPVQNRPPVQPPVQPRPAQPPVQPRPAQPPVQPRPAQPSAASAETTVLNQGAGETTVLGQGAGETTVLSQAVNGGTLTRASNNERIPIASANFTVGRERNSVDFCVSGNTNISRVHARFVVRDGATYIVDNKAANGTFVNGVKARSGQEIKLNDGDTVLLADEKFTYNK